MNIDEFRDGIFALHTRRFGTVAEIMVKKLYSFEESGSLAFDKKDTKNNQKIEIKFSRALKENECSITEKNVIDQCLKATAARREFASTDATKYSFDCNIQQVKSKEFDILYYGIFYSDVVEIYKITNEQVKQLSNYSDKQHRGNVGEGQFHIGNTNIEFHRENYLDKVITYEELYTLFDI